jgi:23S rRNA maturation mini-RNase III
METESSFRMVQSLALAYEAGAIWQDEMRAAVMDELDVPSLHSTVPGSDSNDSQGSAVPSQGNSGSVGSMQDNSNDLRDLNNN